SRRRDIRASGSGEGLGWATSQPPLQACVHSFPERTWRSSTRALRKQWQQHGGLIMNNSKDRLLTTHAGSLVRPASIVVAMRAKEAGEPYDEQALAADARQSAAEVVRHQAAAGVDIPSDGEQAKASFFRYLNDRLTGLTPTRLRPGETLPTQVAAKDRR